MKYACAPHLSSSLSTTTPKTQTREKWGLPRQSPFFYEVALGLAASLIGQEVQKKLCNSHFTQDIV